MERIKHLPVNVEWHKDSPLPSFLIDSPFHRDTDLSDAPLLKRAWFLQEQLLVPRTLIFSETQVH
jgi:hypothetical protein